MRTIPRKNVKSIHTISIFDTSKNFVQYQPKKYTGMPRDGGQNAFDTVFVSKSGNSIYRKIRYIGYRIFRYIKKSIRYPTLTVPLHVQYVGTCVYAMQKKKKPPPANISLCPLEPIQPSGQSGQSHTPPLIRAPRHPPIINTYTSIRQVFTIHLHLPTKSKTQQQQKKLDMPPCPLHFTNQRNDAYLSANEFRNFAS